ncbi:MAG: phosphoribosylanthranilate isomerase [Uliginosibacterium sp.]|nr:phosphoribosylanthranilate isomerase [Uliginosibacterium sp.]
MRTRTKICGLTRVDDVKAAVEAGADAIGLVFYPSSPRAVDIEQAVKLCAVVPPFVSIVGLFVNASTSHVQDVLSALPISLLQFHGEEEAAYCESFGRAYLKAARVRQGFDLLDYAARYPSACGLLVDAWVDGYGGGGHAFDWRLLPSRFDRPLVLAGGLTPENVGEAIKLVRPWAVDVSSGVELSKGVKDRALINAFIAGVRDADGRKNQ